MLRGNVQRLLGSGHPALDTIAKYYFQAEGKHIRPLIVLLLSQATNGLAPGFDERRRMELSGQRQGGSGRSIDEPLEPRAEDVLNDANPSAAASAPAAAALLSGQASNVLPSQRRLAEITEMIHVASLLHDDVIDASDMRRSQPSAPSAFGNKLSILGGDFLLARASLYLSRLGSNEVVELVASVLANLVEGEVMQIKGNTPDAAPATKLTPEIFEHYMKKTYLKTASLIAKSSRATTVLGGAGEGQGWVEGERIKDAAYSYGRNLGIAFQVSGPASVARTIVVTDFRGILCMRPARRRPPRFPVDGYAVWQAITRRGSQAGSSNGSCSIRMGRIPGNGRDDPSQIRGRRRCRAGQCALSLYGTCSMLTAVDNRMRLSLGKSTRQSIIWTSSDCGACGSTRPARSGCTACAARV